MNVVLAARSGDRLESLVQSLRSTGAKAVAVPTDVGKRRDLKALVKSANETFSAIDVLVNNAAIAR